MNLEELRVLVDYHYWARDHVLDAAAPLAPEQFTRDMGSSFRSVHDNPRPLLPVHVALIGMSTQMSSGRL